MNNEVNIPTRSVSSLYHTLISTTQSALGSIATNKLALKVTIALNWVAVAVKAESSTNRLIDNHLYLCLALTLGSPATPGHWCD